MSACEVCDSQSRHSQSMCLIQRTRHEQSPEIEQNSPILVHRLRRALHVVPSIRHLCIRPRPERARVRCAENAVERKRVRELNQDMRLADGLCPMRYLVAAP